VQFRFVCGDGKIGDRDDADDGEERAGWLPAFRAAADVVMEDVRGEGCFDFIAGTVAVELSTGEGGAPFENTIVDDGVERGNHNGDEVVVLWEGVGMRVSV